MPKKKSDLELMNEFNLKYSFMSHDEFIDAIMRNSNDCKYTRIFKEVLNKGSYEDCNDWNMLIKFKLAIKDFNPLKADLQHNLSIALRKIQVAIDNC